MEKDEVLKPNQPDKQERDYQRPGRLVESVSGKKYLRLNGEATFSSDKPSKR